MKSTTAIHILPMRLYLTVAMALVVLTALTVLVSLKNFGEWNLVIALGIAAAKASLIVLYFMHLRYDNLLFAIIFILTVCLLAAFIIFIMFDIEWRGQVNPQSAGVIRVAAAIYDADGNPIPMAQRLFETRQGTLPSGGEPVDEVPFEIRHGYGPLREIVEVGPLDTAMALKGQQIFESKCATCHKLDERYTGPPLRGVTAYRSPTFIMNQILDPQQNVAKHPDMQAMLKTYYTFMTNQNVTVEQARMLVEYLRWETSKGAP